MSTLPNKLSALLRLAVTDAQACEAMPETYRLDMGTWHDANTSKHCLVCMAGAVMARTLGVSSTETIWPRRIDDMSERHALYAIDDLRTGDFDLAAKKLNIAATPALGELSNRVRREYYNADSELDRLSWPRYLEIADELERMGL